MAKRERPNAWTTESFGHLQGRIHDTFKDAKYWAHHIVALKSQRSCEPVTIIKGVRRVGMKVREYLTYHIYRL